MNAQTIFYWNLVTRNVARAFELNPSLQPTLSSDLPSDQATIELSEAQARVCTVRFGEVHCICLHSGPECVITIEMILDQTHTSEGLLL